MQVLDGRVAVDYGSAVFDSGVGSDDVTTDFTEQSNGLCDASTPGVLRLMTASHSGEVRFSVDLFDSEPDVPDDYEDIVEVSFVPESARCSLQGFWGDELGAVELTEAEYRIRYCGRNLDQAHTYEIDAEYDEYVALDEYLLQIWPAPAAPDLVLREVSEFACVRNAARATQADVAVFSTPETHRSRIYGLQRLLSLGAARVGLDDDPVFVRGLDDALRVCDAAIRGDVAEPGDKAPSVGKTRRSAARRIKDARRAALGAASSVPLKGQMHDPAWLKAQAWWALWDLMTAASDPEDSNTYDLALIHCRNLLDDKWRTVEPEEVPVQDPQTFHTG